MELKTGYKLSQLQYRTDTTGWVTLGYYDHTVSILAVKRIAEELLPHFVFPFHYESKSNLIWVPVKSRYEGRVSLQTGNKHNYTEVVYIIEEFQHYSIF